jgi:predicted ATPase
VGPNGSGKSNFLDALRFVSDSLRFSLDHALRDRGGINEVRRRSSGHQTHFGIRLDFALSDARGSSLFAVAKTSEGYEVQREECVLVSTGPSGRNAAYRVEEGAGGP